MVNFCKYEQNYFKNKILYLELKIIKTNPLIT